MILKDRPFLEGEIIIDLGKISITNRTKQKKGRWKHSPELLVYVNIMDIKIDNIKIDC